MIRRFATSEAMARWRLFNAAVFIVLGIAVGANTFVKAGLSGVTVPSYVLAAALIALGAYRLRLYVKVRAEKR